MKNLRVPFSFFVVCLILFSFTQSNWKEVLKEDDVTVYNQSIEGHKFKQSKVETTIKYGSLDKAEKILKDVANYKNWQPNCESSEVINSSSNKISMYLVFGAPWPVTDRDLVLESSFSRVGKKLIVKTTSKTALKPEQEDYVRITYCEGLWEIEEQANGNLFLRNINHSNPGGNIPAWLSSTAVEDIPLQTMQNFIELLK